MMNETKNTPGAAIKKIISSPHVRHKDTTQKIMLCVIIALLPTSLFGIYNFGVNALLHILITIISCLLSEYIFCAIVKKKNSIPDLSAVVTGLLLALNLPPAAPVWIGIVGGAFAIIVVKMLFGGLGANFMNPALGGRAFLMMSFAGIMTNFDIDAYTGPTPLAVLKSGGDVNLFNMFIGNTAGTIGETSAIAILIGAAFLVIMGIISLRIPVTYIITLLIFTGIFGGHGFDPAYLAGNLCGGGLMLGAFFMATDYVTRPITKGGQYVFAIILGILTGIFRLFSGSAEGVCYAIIFTNVLVPLIEKATVPKAFGKTKRTGNKA